MRAAVVPATPRLCHSDPFQRFLEELTATLDDVVVKVDDLSSQLGDADVANLRSRVGNAEDTPAEMSGQLGEIPQRLEALELVVGDAARSPWPAGASAMGRSGVASRSRPTPTRRLLPT